MVLFQIINALSVGVTSALCGTLVQNLCHKEDENIIKIVTPSEVNNESSVIITEEFLEKIIIKIIQNNSADSRSNYDKKMNLISGKSTEQSSKSISNTKNVTNSSEDMCNSRCQTASDETEIRKLPGKLKKDKNVLTSTKIPLKCMKKKNFRFKKIFHKICYCK